MKNSSELHNTTILSLCIFVIAGCANSMMQYDITNLYDSHKNPVDDILISEEFTESAAFPTVEVADSVHLITENVYNVMTNEYNSFAHDSKLYLLNKSNNSYGNIYLSIQLCVLRQ